MTMERTVTAMITVTITVMITLVIRTRRPIG
jgi:hypothetical protein